MCKVRNGVAVLLLVLSALVIGLARPVPANAEAATLTTNITQTLGSVRFYPCAGEYIELFGDYHLLFHVTFDPTGGTHVLAQRNSEGVSGVGLQSGTGYHAMERGNRSTNIFGAPGFDTTYIDRFQLIGEGQASNLLVSMTIHATYAPDQGFTAQITNVSSECN